MKDLNVFSSNPKNYTLFSYYICVNGEENAGTRWETVSPSLQISVTVVDFLFVQHKQDSSLNSSKYQTSHVNASAVQLIVQRRKE